MDRPEEEEEEVQQPEVSANGRAIEGESVGKLRGWVQAGHNDNGHREGNRWRRLGDERLRRLAHRRSLEETTCNWDPNSKQIRRSVALYTAREKRAGSEAHCAARAKGGDETGEGIALPGELARVPAQPRHPHTATTAAVTAQTTDAPPQQRRRAAPPLAYSVPLNVHTWPYSQGPETNDGKKKKKKK